MIGATFALSLCLAVAAVGGAVLADEGPIASRYPGDAGIRKDPAVIFADDFEAWTDGGIKPRAGTWDTETKTVSRTGVVPGKVEADGLSGPRAGSGVLEVACWSMGRGEASGGVTLKLGNYDHANEGRGDGYDELFVRYYIKFDDNFRGMPNHGANLGGRDVSRPGSAWAGQAAIRDIASHGYFYSGLQPYGKNGSRELEMGFYSYHLDKHDQWGDSYEVQKHIPIQVGEWHCVERHMKLNSVSADGIANMDGVEELWVDGQLSIRKAVRFRKTKSLKITFFSLGMYYHKLTKEYDAEHPVKVYFDNVVIARKYIGPMDGGGPVAGRGD